MTPIFWNKFPGLLQIEIPRDGSCFFHAILHAMDSDYRVSDKRSYVLEFRRQLLSNFTPAVYDKLSLGQLGKFHKSVSGYTEKYSYENMKRDLLKSSSIGIEFNEFISDLLNIDIYLFDLERMDIYFTGEEETLHKGRRSIVLLVTGNHYDLVGLDGPEIKTLFDPDDPLIVTINRRIRESKGLYDMSKIQPPRS